MAEPDLVLRLVFIDPFGQTRGNQASSNGESDIHELRCLVGIVCLEMQYGSRMLLVYTVNVWTSAKVLTLMLLMAGKKTHDLWTQMLDFLDAIEDESSP